MNKEKRNSVLVVDDEKANIMVLTNILSPEYIVYAAGNGTDAIKAAEKFLPDVILLDIIMPEMDGYTIITALKNSAITQNIPVVFFTGLSNVADEEKGLALGAADYITKPFSPAIVKLRLRNQIKIINQMREILGKELAEKISHDRIEFLMRMNHEMLTPMNTIIGMTKMLKMPGGLAKTKEYLDSIETASSSLMGLINNLLNISENNGIMFPLDSTVFSFNTMYQNIIKLISFIITEKQQTLVSNIDKSIPEQLLGDEKRLSQVIANLLSNAVKFTPEEGKIIFSAHLLEEDDDSITMQIEVSDNGLGMTKDQQSHIFNIFGQIDGSSNVYSGVGLGLPISKRIIETMGGRIWVESEPDKGSKFTFTCKLKKI